MNADGAMYLKCECGYVDYDSAAKFCSRCGIKRPGEEEQNEALNSLIADRIKDLGG